MREWLAQLVWPALVGVLAATILLNNEWLELPGGNQGPASYSEAVAIATPAPAIAPVAPKIPNN